MIDGQSFWGIFTRWLDFYIPGTFVVGLVLPLVGPRQSHPDNRDDEFRARTPGASSRLAWQPRPRAARKSPIRPSTRPPGGDYTDRQVNAKAVYQFREPTAIGRYCSNTNDLARVQEVVGIERAFDGAHHRDRLAMLGDQQVHLAIADPMLSGAGPFHCQRPSNHPLVKLCCLDNFLGMIGIDHENEVKIAVTDMTDKSRGHRRFGQIFLGQADALGQSRNGYTNIGRPTF